MMLYKLKEEEEEEEEEEEIKNYSGALIFLSLLFLVLYVFATIFEYKKEKEYGKTIYNKGVSLGKAAADRLKRKPSQSSIQSLIQSPNLYVNLLSSPDTSQYHLGSTLQGSYQPP
jgi:flagellar basal body-associated protein FliL